MAIADSSSGSNDVISGNGNANNLIGTEYGDLIKGLGGNDTIRAHGGDDFITGGDGNDKIFGHAGDDFISGDAGKDTINGGEGNDNLFGNNGADTIYGGAGNDYISGGLGIDYLDGGDGVDTVDFTNDLYASISNNGSYSDKNSGEGNQHLGGLKIRLDLQKATLVDGRVEQILNFENVVGSSDNDLIVGNDLDNILVGGSGVDTMWGGAGDDILWAPSGSLHGEGGDDIFDFIYFHGESSYQIDGGGGYDQVVLTGHIEDYHYQTQNNNSIQITSKTSSQDGVVVVNDIEEIAFRTKAVVGSLYQNRYTEADLEGLTTYTIEEIRQYAIDNPPPPPPDFGDITITRLHSHQILLHDTVDGSETIHKFSNENSMVEINGSTYTNAEIYDAMNSNVVNYQWDDSVALDDVLYINDNNFSANPNGKIILEDIDGGKDTIDFSSITRTVRIDGMGENSFVGLQNIKKFVGFEVVKAGSGDDWIRAPDFSENNPGFEIHGNAGDDTLLGHHGDDTIYGGEGDDYLSGGAGYNQLYGGIGNDIFYGYYRGNKSYFDGGEGIDIADMIYNRDKYDVVFNDKNQIKITHVDYGGTKTFENIEIFEFRSDGKYYADYVNKTLTKTPPPDYPDDPPPPDEPDDPPPPDEPDDPPPPDEPDDPPPPDEPDEPDLPDFGNYIAKMIVPTGIWEVVNLDDNSSQIFKRTVDDYVVVNDVEYEYPEIFDIVRGNFEFLDWDTNASQDDTFSVSGDDYLVKKNGVLIVSDTDGGENDILDFSNITHNLYITLEGRLYVDTYDNEVKTFANVGHQGMAFMGFEIIKGGSGNDVLDCYKTSDNILYGNAGNDELYGSDGNNELYGGTGDDYIELEKVGTDYVDGGDGNDSILFRQYLSKSTFNFIDSATFEVTNVDTGIVKTITNVENFAFQESSNTYYTLSELKSLLGLTNIMDGSDGVDKLQGGAEIDEIEGGAGNDRLFGNAGNDIMNGGNGDDRLDGGDDNDILTGANGADDLRGDAGDDTISGGKDNDVLYGLADNDTLNGDAGNDNLFGGDGSDVLNGGNHHDRLLGEDGDDELNGERGADRLEGGLGNDMLSGGDDNDLLLGEEGDDTLNGDAGRDELIGGAGNDLLNGGGAKDRLYGGDDADTLIGGAGEDIMYGEGGADVFGFTEIDGRIDRIKDFEDGTDFLNITDILQGYDSATDDINDFVLLGVKSANKAKLFVNADGEGNDFAKLTLINGADFTGTTVDDLLADGTLITDQSLIV